MSRTELLENSGSAWGLIVVVVALALVCAAWVAVVPWLLDLHRQRVGVVRRATSKPQRAPSPTQPSPGDSWAQREDDE